MANIVKLNYTADEINQKLSEVGEIKNTYATKKELDEVADSIHRWAADTQYEVGDTVLVYYNENATYPNTQRMYRCKTAHTSKSLSSSYLTTNWEEIFMAARAFSDEAGNNIKSYYTPVHTAVQTFATKKEVTNNYATKEELSAFATKEEISNLSTKEELSTLIDNIIMLQEDFLDGFIAGATGDCTWYLINTVLTISGNGAMGNYASSSKAPWGTNITKVIIEDGVTSIGNCAFYNCESLTNITIPDSVTSIGSYAFYYCNSLTSIIVDENNKNYSSLDGVLFNKDKTALVCYPAGKTNTSYTIPNSVTSISYGAFCGCSSLTSITIPDSVTNIDSYAFNACSNLTSITIPDSVKNISDNVFSNCSSLTSITIPDSVTNIGASTFYYCTSLKTASLGNSITRIPGDMFVGCSSLTSITIPSSVTSIGHLAFGGCDSLSDVYYAGSEAEAKAINIDEYNALLTTATWHYNCAG